MNLRHLMQQCNCDKYTHHYDSVYEHAIKDGDRILEIGVFRGESLGVWLQAYPNSKITVVDTFQRIGPKQVPHLDHPNVTWYKAKSEDVDLGDAKFDIIIDDGCHLHTCQINTFKNLIKYLDEGGRYFIEDVWPFDKMTPEQRKHPWVQKGGYSEALYRELKELVKPYDRNFHDMRSASGKPDSFLIEVKK